MVVSEEIHSPQNYLELMTGECYCYNGDSDYGFIREMLEENGLEKIRMFGLADVASICGVGINVVLVECMETDELSGEYIKVLYWMEVTDEALEELE